MNDIEAMQVFRFLVERSMADAMFYGINDGSLWVAVNCNDLFYWACADMEEITPERLPLLEQCIADCDKAYVDHNGEHREGYGHIFADLLYACRVREMRPQTPYYELIAPWLRPLIDACGPPRDTEAERIRAEQKYEEYPAKNKDKKICSQCKGTGRLKEAVANVG